jgi:hypothetical protein
VGGWGGGWGGGGGGRERVDERKKVMMIEREKDMMSCGSRVGKGRSEGEAGREAEKEYGGTGDQVVQRGHEHTCARTQRACMSTERGITRNDTLSLVRFQMNAIEAHMKGAAVRVMHQTLEIIVYIRNYLHQRLF